MPKLSMIFASDLNGGIGLKGELPWKLKDYPVDMKFFKETSMEYSNLITGRVNYESMGPLKGRISYVLTSRGQIPEEGLKRHVTVDLDILNNLIGRQNFLVVGGAETYKAFQDKADKAYRTTIKKELECDVFYVLPEEFVVEEVIYEDEEILIEVLTRC